MATGMTKYSTAYYFVWVTVERMRRFYKTLKNTEKPWAPYEKLPSKQILEPINYDLPQNAVNTEICFS